VQGPGQKQVLMHVELEKHILVCSSSVFVDTINCLNATIQVNLNFQGVLMGIGKYMFIH